MPTINTQEVASMLGKSSEQVRRYAHQGLLAATRSGKDLLFDRDEVLAFARERRIDVSQAKPEREVPQGSNFYQEFARVMQKAPPGSSLTFTKPPSLVRA